MDGQFGREQIAACYVGLAQKMSLHDDDPSGTGANEIAGGSPAYARRTVTWLDQGNGVYLGSLDEPFDVPANSNVVWAGFWTTDGEYVDKQPCAFSADDQDTFEPATITYTVPAS